MLYTGDSNNRSDDRTSNKTLILNYIYKSNHIFLSAAQCYTLFSLRDPPTCPCPRLPVAVPQEHDEWTEKLGP